MKTGRESILKRVIKLYEFYCNVDKGIEKAECMAAETPKNYRIIGESKLGLSSEHGRWKKTITKEQIGQLCKYNERLLYLLTDDVHQAAQIFSEYNEQRRRCAEEYYKNIMNEANAVEQICLPYMGDND